MAVSQLDSARAVPNLLSRTQIDDAANQMATVLNGLIYYDTREKKKKRV